MKLSGQLIHMIFVALLVLTTVLSHSNRVAAADYANLPASAQDTTPLKKGDRAPAFTVRTVDDEEFNFDPENLERTTVLISFRGGWCPYCNMHLSELRTVIPQITKGDADVLFLSNDAPYQLYSSLNQETRDDIAGLDYTILSDAEINAGRALGAAFRTDERMTDDVDEKGREYSGTSIGKHNALAVPAVYVVDRTGMIVYDFVTPDYKVRISAEDLLVAVDAAM